MLMGIDWYKTCLRVFWFICFFYLDLKPISGYMIAFKRIERKDVDMIKKFCAIHLLSL